MALQSDVARNRAVGLERSSASLLLASTASAALLLASTTAFAADMRPIITKAPPVVPLQGPCGDRYVGVHAGYLWGEFDTDEGIFDDAKAHGFLGGLQAGLACRTSNFVLGIEGSFSAVNAGFSESQGLGPRFGGGFEGQAIVDFSWLALATLRGRAGMEVGQGVQLFVTGGLAAGEIKRGLNGSVFDTPFSNDDTFWKVGWTAGGGIDIPFSRDWSFTVQYLHVDLGHDSFSAAVEFVGDQRKRLTADIVTGGINIHF